jgi:hypothetical protein
VLRRLLIVVRHFGVMVLTPEQHSSIAMAYERAAADEMVPPPQRAVFARKADWFRMLARIGAKPKLLATIQRTKAAESGEAFRLRANGKLLFEVSGDGRERYPGLGLFV